MQKLVQFLLVLISFQKINGEVALPDYNDILKNITTFPEISWTCAQHVQTLINDLQESKTWALQMIDSSSKIPSGLFTGNIFEMGNYDECLAIESGTDIEPKFCSTTVNLPYLQEFLMENATRITRAFGIPIENIIRMFFCVPKSCTPKDLQSLFKSIIKVKDCSYKGPRQLDELALSAIIFFSIIILLSGLSTIYDLYKEWKGEIVFNPMLTAFSLYSNSKKLFLTNNTQQLDCVNGIKAISMIWIVLIHVYMTYTIIPIKNYLDVWEWFHSLHSQAIKGGSVAVDTFLVIGGFLTCYSYQKAMDKGIKFNIPMFYFHRYLRLTPSLAAMVLAHVALFNYLGNGPIWSKTDTELVKNCKKYWWSALLYVQNYVNTTELCIPQTWYLSVDMQLFLISPLILLPLRRWPRLTNLGVAIGCLGSIVCGFMVAWTNELTGTIMVQGNGGLRTYMTKYYKLTHTRMVPYLLGVMLATIVYKLKKDGKKIKMNRVIVFLLWLASFALLLVSLFGGLNIQKYNRLEGAFFVALIKPTWSVGICWLIFGCIMDLGGIINKILSLKIFQVLSRLSYSIYIVHYSFLFMTSFNNRSSVFFSDYIAIHKFWGDLFFILIISIFWTLLFESPIIILEKILIGGERQKKDFKTKADIPGV